VFVFEKVNVIHSRYVYNRFNN